MQIEEARKILDETETDYKTKNRVAKGLMILDDFSDEIECRFEHDQMWAGDFEGTVKRMDEHAVETMAKLGWFESEESWSHF